MFCEVCGRRRCIGEVRFEFPWFCFVLLILSVLGFVRLGITGLPFRIYYETFGKLSSLQSNCKIGAFACASDPC